MAHALCAEQPPIRTRSARRAAALIVQCWTRDVCARAAESAVGVAAWAVVESRLDEADGAIRILEERAADATAVPPPITRTSKRTAPDANS